MGSRGGAPVVIPARIAGQPVRERRMREEGEGADARARAVSGGAGSACERRGDAVSWAARCGSELGRGDLLG